MILRNIIDSWRYQASDKNPCWQIIPNFIFRSTQAFNVITEWDISYRPFDEIEGVDFASISRRNKIVYIDWYADRGAVFRAIKALLEKSAKEYRQTQLEHGG